MARLPQPMPSKPRRVQLGRAVSFPALYNEPMIQRAMKAMRGGP